MVQRKQSIRAVEDFFNREPIAQGPESAARVF
jgi:hypothetical protein